MKKLNREQMKNLTNALLDLVGVSFASAGVWANMDHIRTVILFLLGVIFLGFGIISRYLDIKIKIIDMKKKQDVNDINSNKKGLLRWILKI
jgi:hypothetical protein